MAPKLGRGEVSAASDLEDLIPIAESVGERPMSRLLRAGWGRRYYRRRREPRVHFLSGFDSRHDPLTPCAGLDLPTPDRMASRTLGQSGITGQESPCAPRKLYFFTFANITPRQ